VEVPGEPQLVHHGRCRMSLWAGDRGRIWPTTASTNSSATSSSASEMRHRHWLQRFLVHVGDEGHALTVGETNTLTADAERFPSGPGSYCRVLEPRLPIFIRNGKLTITRVMWSLTTNLQPACGLQAS
jgi:hypothetical protein